MKYDDVNLNKEISNALIYCGVPANLIGYGYLKEAIRMAVEDPCVMRHTMSALYPQIAQRVGGNSSKVERGIRVAVERVFQEMPPKYLEKCFGGCVRFNKGKLTNSEFIAVIAERIREDSGPWK